MSVAGDDIIIAIEPVSGCIVQLLTTLSYNFHLTLAVIKILKSFEIMKRALSDNGGRRSGIDRRQFSYTAYIPERRSGRERRSGFDRRLGERMSG
jgi:hypothetical protein